MASPEDLTSQHIDSIFENFKKSKYSVGADLASDVDYFAIYTTVEGSRFSKPFYWPAVPANPKMRNVTPQKPKLLKESNE